MPVDRQLLARSRPQLGVTRAVNKNLEKNPMPSGVPSLRPHRSEALMPRLHGRLWHTTRPDRFESIVRDGAILPEPANVPDTERWGTANGPRNHPYARFIGGSSLFDFRNFDG